MLFVNTGKFEGDKNKTKQNKKNNSREGEAMV